MPIDESADHYVILAENMPPTRLVCKCGEVYEGPDCLAHMSAHVHEGNES